MAPYRRFASNSHCANNEYHGIENMSQYSEEQQYYNDNCIEDQERRSRLCNYIMEDQFPMHQPVIRSRHMDYYFKNFMERNRQSELKINNSQLYESNGTLYGGNESPKLKSLYRQPLYETKSRYLDYLKKQDSYSHKRINCKTLGHNRLDWKHYHRLSTIHEFLDELQYNYPSLCTTGSIGKSLGNRDLKVLKVSNSTCSNPGVWIDAGIHAREWIAPAVNTYILNYIVTNYDELPKSMANRDWYFLPVMNPDGYEFSHTTYRMWRKNRALIGGDYTGVDLNRNFSYGWGGPGSSEDPNSAFYRGPFPFSEPESQAVRDMLKSSGIKFQVYLTFHSYGQVILFPFAYRDELCPDYIRLLEGATAMSKAIYKTTGNTYKVGISRDVMYGAAGTSCDWSYGEAKIPYCYLLELTSKKYKFRLPSIEIEETGKETLSAIIALMNFLEDRECDDII